MIKRTRRSLIAAVAAIFICIALFAGTTYAWFTYSKTTTNVIESGNLDISMYQGAYSVGGGTITYDSTAVTETTNLFSDVALWEPGATQVVYLKIENTGTLTAEVNLNVIISSETQGVNVNGADFSLSDYLYIGQTGGTTETIYATRAEAQAIAAEQLSAYDNSSSYITMAAGDIYYYTIVVCMPSTVGNEANYYGTAPEITLGVALTAVQSASESDSYGSDYDDGLITTSAALNTALATATSGDVVTLSSGTYTLDSGTTIAEGVTIQGGGTDNTTIVVPATTSGSNTTGLVIENEGVTISDVTLEANSSITSNNYCGVVAIKSGDVTLDNVEITVTNSAASAVVISSFDSGTVTISNSTISVKSRAIFIVDGADGTVVIDNCDITGIYTFNVNSASSTNLVMIVKDSALHGWTSYGVIASATFTNTEFSKGSSSYDYLRPYSDTTLESCTFDSSFLMGCGTTGFTITITDCSQEGTTITVDNLVGTIVDETDSPDYGYMQSCTVIINGTQITWD